MFKAFPSFDLRSSSSHGSLRYRMVLTPSDPCGRWKWDILIYSWASILTRNRCTSMRVFFFTWNIYSLERIEENSPRLRLANTMVCEADGAIISSIERMRYVSVRVHRWKALLENTRTVRIIISFTRLGSLVFIGHVRVHSLFLDQIHTDDWKWRCLDCRDVNFRFSLKIFFSLVVGAFV